MADVDPDVGLLFLEILLKSVDDAKREAKSRIVRGKSEIEHLELASAELGIEILASKLLERLKESGR